MSLRRRFADLRLVWKLLVPLVGMTLVVGLLGAFLTVRDLTNRARVTLEEDVLRRSVIAEATARDLGLYLAESARFGANIEGVPEAVARGDADAARALVASVPAARPRLDLVVAAGDGGVGLVEVRRAGDGLEIGSGTQWSEPGRAGPLFADPDLGEGGIGTGFVRVAGEWMLATTSAVTVDSERRGTMLVGIRAGEVAGVAAERASAPVDLFDRSGRRLASSEDAAGRAGAPEVAEHTRVRRTEEAGGEEVTALYGLLEVGGDEVGRMAVRVPTAPAFAGVRGATLRLALIVLAAMAGVVGLGVLVARVVLAQVRPLVETNRALGRGDFSARAPVLGNDELGELARGINLMAEQLEAGREEIDLAVAARTEELERLYRKGLSSEQGRSELLAEIVHEFRNQLLAIRSYAELLTDTEFEPDDPGWRREYGEGIGEAADELLHRVDDVLDLARSEAGRMEFDLDAVGVPEILAKLHTTITALARRGDLTAEVDVPDGLPPVRADRHRVVQIILNLVSNAVKYTPPGGHIGVRARAVDDGVEVSVHDTGIGIPGEAGLRVFEPFYRVSSAAAERGLTSTGLGLAVTKRLVEGQGGGIWYTGNPGGGTTFTFTLPGVATPVARRRRRGRAAGRAAASARR